MKEPEKILWKQAYKRAEEMSCYQLDAMIGRSRFWWKTNSEIGLYHMMEKAAADQFFQEYKEIFNAGARHGKEI